jgi:hypothetical protein
MEAIATPYPIRQPHRPFTRRRGVATKPGPQRAPEPTSDAFLSQRIEPLISVNSQRFTDPKRTEQDFFTSLNYLEKLYSFRVVEAIRHQLFPQNVALAYLEAQQAIKNYHADMKLDIFDLSYCGRAGASTACLVTYFTFEEPSVDSYWIPLLPVALRRNQKDFGPQVNLLRSILAYFDGVGHVPWYGTDESWLGRQLEYYLEFYDDRDQDDEESRETGDFYRNEIGEARQQGNKIRKWWHQGGARHQLYKLRRRLDSFVPLNKFDEELRTLAQDVLNLYADYPGRSIYRSYADEAILLAEGDEYAIDLDCYLTFNWDNFSSLSEQSFDDLNQNECANTSTFNNPVQAQYFDSPQATIDINNDFSFEKRYFKAADELCIYLNNLQRQDRVTHAKDNESV